MLVKKHESQLPNREMLVCLECLKKDKATMAGHRGG